MGKPSDQSFLPRRLRRKIGSAFHDYAMLDDGDRVLVGVSGGVDSSLLAWMLPFWRLKAPIDYSITAVYIDNGFPLAENEEEPAERISRMMERFGVKFVVEAAWPIEVERTCYLCARNRRSQLFDMAKREGINKIALGHHLDDLIETLYLNMIYSGNISTMVPRQDLFDGELAIIRPFAYVEKQEIRELARRLAIEPVKNTCPLEKDTRRTTVRKLLEDLYALEPAAKQSLLQAMKNIRHDYLL